MGRLSFDCLKIYVIDGSSSFESYLRRLAGIWSGSKALHGFRPGRSVAMPFSIILSSDIGGWLGPSSLRSSVSGVSSVKTEANCWPNASAYQIASATSFPPDWSRTTPVVSCLYGLQ